MPPPLTAATGIDALFHNLEAYFVTVRAAILDGLDSHGIARCDNFALNGTSLIVRWLPRAYSNANDLEARLHLQIAALLGAKAFRKGDLGGIHATAHAIGARYHLHHGTAIARMAVPVLAWNEERADVELRRKLETVKRIFEKISGGGRLSEIIEIFLGSLKLDVGLRGLPLTEKDIPVLAELAAKDGCQTNPVLLGVQDYNQIFMNAWKI